MAKRTPKPITGPLVLNRMISSLEQQVTERGVRPALESDLASFLHVVTLMAQPEEPDDDDDLLGPGDEGWSEPSRYMSRNWLAPGVDQAELQKILLSKRAISTDTENDWRDDSLCAQTDPDVFYSDAGSDYLEGARAICNLCEVKVECLEYALTHNETLGVWGGMGEYERRQILGQTSMTEVVQPD